MPNNASRQQAAKALEESEERLHGIVDSAMDAILSIDEEQRIVLFNRAAEQMFGCSASDALGTPVERFIPEPFRGDHARFVEAFGRGNVTPRSMGRLGSLVAMRANGETFPIEASISRVAVEGGIVFTAIIRDVTEQKRADEALRSSETRHRLLFETMVHGAVHQDKDGKILAMNSAAERILGRAREEVVGLGSDSLWLQRLREDGSPFPEDERPSSVALRTGREVKRVLMHVYNPKADAFRLVRIDAVPLFRPGESRPFEVYTTFEDVTDQESALRALRESEERFRDLANSMPQLVWTAAADGTIDYHNTRALEYAQRSDQGRLATWLDVVHPADLPPTRDAWRAAVEGGGAFQVEHRMQMADGAYRWHLSRATLVRHAGAEARWFGTATDIHDRKQAEESLRESDRRKDDFIAVLGHELRNPLTPIRNAASIMKLAGDNPAALARSRDMIDRQVTHMTRLIDDLLDVSRISRGKISLKREMVDLSRVVETAATDMAPSAEKLGLRLLCVAPGAPVWVFGDEPRLRQIVTNLLHNATKFTEAGGSITITLRFEGEMASIEVRDTGIGIDSSAFQTIFIPFSQADHPASRTAGGLGLGLALVKGLTELHGGRVSVDSEGLGRGSTFTVVLPMAQRRELIAGPGAPGRALGRHNILVIEDNPDIAESLQALLFMKGHDVSVAYTGGEGLKLARAIRPRVVICDLGLPDQSGYDVARAIRADPNLAGVLLIAATGYGQEEDRRRTREAGFDHHLTKPPDLAALEALLP